VREKKRGFKREPSGKDLPRLKRLWRRAGYHGKTLWDWQVLLIVPIAAALIVATFTAIQVARQGIMEEQRARAELQVANQRAQDEALEAYINQMTQIMLGGENALLGKEPDPEVRVAARAWTLTALKRLDGEHNKSVITFVKESGLVTFRTSRGQKGDVLRLDEADLSGVNLANNELGGFNLRAAELRNANLHEATISVANLTFADLSNADLTGAELRDASLIFADLKGADLKGADLRHADLRGADLKTAKHLTQKQIDEANEGNAATRLPEDLQVPSRWISTNPSYNVKSDPRLQGAVVAVGRLRPDLVAQAGIPAKGIPKEKEPTSGALVYRVPPDSLAEDAGLQFGDIIVKVGPHQESPVHGPADLRDLDQHKAAGEIKFTVWRHYFEGYEEGPVYVRLDP
jgi:hypothetical protein